MYRLIDFKRKRLGVLAKVCTIEYDPNRNCRISLLHYLDGYKAYVLHVQGVCIGDRLVSDFEAPIRVGNSLPLNKIPLGVDVCNVEFQELEL